MERLSSLDAVFLAVEDPVNQMNIGTVAIFEGPAPGFDAVRNSLAARIAAIPRCRQRVCEPSGLIGRTVWIDDVDFDFDHHIHAASIDGDDPDALDKLLPGLMTPVLDRRRALWELWVVDGLAGNRWAIIAKVHHCMVDGIAGSDVLSAILDRDTQVSSTALDNWVPTPEPSAAALAWFNVASAIRSLGRHLRNLTDAIGHPRRSWRRLSDIARAARRLWYRQHTIPSSLTGPIGTQRRWTRTAVAFDDITAVTTSFGGTVNDVVLAAVTGGFRDLLIHRGEPVDHRTITSMVPVSVRGLDEYGEVGNRVANVHALLPVGLSDPCQRLQAICEHLADLKTSHEIDATGLLLSIGDYCPRVVSGRITKTILHRQRNVETVISNVPGPRTPLYLDGRRMLEGFPIAPIAGRVRITVALWSYCEHLYIGITGDRNTTDDIEHLRRGIEHGFADLAAAARRERRATRTPDQ